MHGTHTTGVNIPPHSFAKSVNNAMRLAFYFSLSFYSMNDCKHNGHCVVPSIQFSMTNRNTVNICNVNCTKFLGKTIDVSFWQPVSWPLII